MEYYIGIDETGNFDIRGGKPSFVGGVVTTGDKTVIKSCLIEALQAGGAQIPEDTPDEEILSKCKLSEWFRGQSTIFQSRNDAHHALETLHASIGPYLVATFRTFDRPMLISNPQHWWYLALQSALKGILEKLVSLDSAGPDIMVRIDFRRDTVIGTDIAFGPYHHQVIKPQLLQMLGPVTQHLGKLDLEFDGDERNYHVALADLVVGSLARHPDLIDKSKNHKFLCSSAGIGPSTVELVKGGEYAQAVREIVAAAVERGSTIDGNELSRLIGQVVENQTEICEFLWEELLSTIERMLAGREYDSDLIFRVPAVINALLPPLDRPWKTDDHLRRKTRIRLKRLKLTLETHLGSPREDSALDFFGTFAEDSPAITRFTERWEKYVEAKVAASQLYFNAYNFDEVEREIGALWTRHDHIRNIQIPGTDCLVDDTTASITGTLGQAYAFLGRYDEAEEFLGEDLTNTLEGTPYRDMANSYLLSIHVRQRRLPQAHEKLCSLLGRDDLRMADEAEVREELAAAGNWKLVDLLRVLALSRDSGIYVPTPAWEVISRQNTGYPYPLALKWAAFIAAKNGDLEQAERLLSDGIAMIDREENQFTIRTLAVPFYLMLGAIRPNRTGPIDVEYNKYIQTIIGVSPYFRTYLIDHVPQHADALAVRNAPKRLSVDCGIESLWDRATALPFYYS